MVTGTNVPSTYPYITHTGPLLGTRRAGIALLEPGDDVEDMAGHRNLVLLGCLSELLLLFYLYDRGDMRSLN